MENKRATLVRATMSRRRHKTLATLGAIVFAMAVIGTITVAIFSFNLTGRLLDNTKAKQKLEHFLLPVVMLDPGDFASPQQADPLMLLQSSIWSVLLSKNRGDLVENDQGYVVTASDVDVQAAKLFGADIRLHHQGIDNYEEQINYDEETKSYTIPVISQMAVYTPRILNISNKGDLYTLEVGYVPPGNLWQTDADGNTYEPEPDKSMIMELKKVKGGYNILSIKNTNEIAVIDPSLNSQVTPSVSSIPEEEMQEGSESDEETSKAASASVSEAFASASVSSSSPSSSTSSDGSGSSSSSEDSSSDSSSSSS